MSYPGTWPTLADFARLVDVDAESIAADATLERALEKQLAAGIALVKDQVGAWDDVIDMPDDSLWGAALRAAYLLSLKESPAAIVSDQVFMTYMVGHRRRFAIA